MRYDMLIWLLCVVQPALSVSFLRLLLSYCSPLTTSGSARSLCSLDRSADHELNIRECCISCLAVNSSPSGQDAAGPSSASLVHPQNPSFRVSSVGALSCIKPVVVVSFVPSFRFAVSLSIISLKGCNNI